MRFVVRSLDIDAYRNESLDFAGVLGLWIIQPQLLVQHAVVWHIIDFRYWKLELANEITHEEALMDDLHLELSVPRIDIGESLELQEYMLVEFGSG